MAQRRSNAGSKKLVWRISEFAPQGEWVDRRPAVSPKPAPTSGAGNHSSWLSSSQDLQDGADVSENSAIDFDELFGPPSKQLATPPTK